MEIENRKSTFIRDLIVRILLIVLFIFLLMYLFPMPNLNTFYDKIFNDNLQTMKEAAEKWYSTDRMPKKVGDTSELSLQDMIDNKLVIPFTDKDGNSCDTNSSYVKVTKKKNEYVLKVSLTCGNQTDYIVEHIGCYNFCKEGKCTQVVQTPASVNTTQPQTTYYTPVAKSYTPSSSVPSQRKYTPSNPTPSNPTPTPTPTPTPEKHYCEHVAGNYYGKNGNIVSRETYENECLPKEEPVYKTIYEYERSKDTETWTLLDWQDRQDTETEDYKLVNIRTQYRGQKKITTGTTLYKHIKYEYKDNWTVDSDWSTQSKEVTDNTKLYATRTLYRGYKPVVTSTNKYRHVKTTTNSKTTTTDWTNQIKATSPTVKLIDTRYKVQKTTQNVGKTTVTTWGDWQKDYTWRSSKPESTSSKQWGSAWDSRVVGEHTNTSVTRVKVDDDYTSTVALSNNSTYTYVFTGTSMSPCTVACNGNSVIRIYHYIRYKNVTNTTTTGGTKQYRYTYRVKVTEKQDTLKGQNVDTKWVNSKSDMQSYVAKGYMLIETQYKYQITSSTSTSDYIWTESITPPEGYTYTGQSTTQTITKYEPIEKWVTSSSKLGEYTYNVETVVQYKYKYNNPTRSIVDTVWTESKVSPDGYIYTGQIKSTESTGYSDMGEWVDSKEKLGEFKYNVEVRRQYQYKKRTKSTYYETKWDEKSPGPDWRPTGKSMTTRVK